ncbi:kinase-like protein [Rhizophagus irregularis]|uniref:Kinase-like protein n=1 Tax=Rhizophagus irregularis TaxID=588596 RepID=A0A2I1GAL2_9GLOM|nr:kinase-like protein [Rhizophagus irregularis]
MSKSGDNLGKSLDVKGHVINKGMKDGNGISSKDSHIGEVSVSQEELEIYNKRNNKDELNRGMVSSDGTDDDGELEINNLKTEDKKQSDLLSENIFKMAMDKQIQWLESGIVECYINCYDYTEFKNIKVIGYGAFGDVYQATWNNSTIFALKSFRNNNLIMKEIVNEIKLLHRVSLHANIIQFFGITKRKNNEDNMDSNSNYLLILEYADSDWNMKLQFAIQIADAVLCVHQNDIIHCDLHSDNILIHQNTIKLADFGLSRRLTEVSTQKDIFGKIPYIDPQHFLVQTNNNNSGYHYKPNKKSDVYSVGVLLWEISSGQKPFKSYDEWYQRLNLIMEISNGKRESPIPNTPVDYINIYTKCWQNNSDDRPDMKQVFSKLKLINLNANETETYSIGTMSNNMMIPNNDKNNILNNENNKMYCNKILTTNIDFNDNNIDLEDEMKAFELYKEEVEKGDINAMNNLGYFYQHGIGIEKDEVMSFLLYKEAVEKGDIESINDLGYCYENGIGTEKVEFKAFELYKKAAEKGDINAIYQLGESAEKGYIIAIYQLGYCHQHGIGTEKNEIKAFEFYKEAAERDDINAIFNLGSCYQYGIGTEKDEVKAFESYKKAADKGNSDAINDLGRFYQHGIGTEKNEIKAYELYKELAEKRHISSIYDLAYCYENGIGTEKDEIKAFKLYEEYVNRP